MLRFLTAGESHGRALVVILEGMPAGLSHRSRRDHARAAPPAGRLRPRPPHGDRVRLAPRSCPACGRARRIGGPIAMLDREPGLGELAAHDAGDRRAAEPDAGGAPARAGDAAAPGPRRSGRRRQVRAQRHPRHPRARQRARDRGARRGRRHRPPAARRMSASASPATSSRSAAPACPAETHRRRSNSAAALPDDSPLRCVDADDRRADDRRRSTPPRRPATRWAARFEVIATGVPVGLGSYVQWDRKLDGRLAQALMSIPAIKAVGIGLGPEVGGAGPARGCTTRSSRIRRARTSPAWRGRPTTPAASKAASPTARTCASPPR